MIEAPWIVVAVACAVGLAWAVFWQYQDAKKAKVEACPGHRWIYVSLYDSGEHWNRYCERCPAHEISYDGPHRGDVVRVGRNEYVRL